jgi:hypothetical protein
MFAHTLLQFGISGARENSKSKPLTRFNVRLNLAPCLCIILTFASLRMPCAPLIAPPHRTA